MAHANEFDSTMQDVSSPKTSSSMPHANRLIIMTRYPEAGKTKTRLIPALDPENAAFLHRELIKHTWHEVFEKSSHRNYDIEVRFFGANSEKMQQLLESNAVCKPQQGESLGEKMHSAVCNAFDEGAKKTILIGTDCPGINESLLNQTFKKLDSNDAVIGPATDGGYYLLGLKQPQKKLFEGMEWGTETVLQQTLDQCKQSNLTVEQLQPLSDVDYPEDLINCRKHGLAFSQNEQRNQPGLISIVIPTLNEEPVLSSTLKALSEFERIEIIIADGGSNDRTLEIAAEHKIRVVQSQAGRGRQMNAGAAVATGEILLFMHADSLLPVSFRQQVQRILKNNVAGAFELEIDGDIFGKSIIEWGANLRSRYRKMPYGDQGFFIKADDFYDLDGFKNWPIMEDYEFCKRIRNSSRIGIASAAMKTSGRRWKKRGLIRNTLRNQLCVLALNLGVSPERIARFYS